jgi:hypothetical protein
VNSDYAAVLSSRNYFANGAFFIFMPAGFAVVASKINDLQVALFPFAFGECFFEVFFGLFDATAVA